MANHTETAAQLFSRCGEVHSYPSFEQKLFHHFTCQDIVEISGEAGSGKTELLYHFIAGCILPSVWKNINFEGLNIEVIFIDNDYHFDLFRLMTILEYRIKSLAQSSDVRISKKEIFLFIQDILKQLFIINCCDSEQFLLTLSSFENTLCLQNKRKMIMIDGISSFYWSDRARFLNNIQKLSSHYKIITNLIIRISKEYQTPVIVTRRKLLNDIDNDKRVFGQSWANATTWRLELKFKASLSDKSLFTLFNVSNSVSKLCIVKNSGFCILENKD